MFNVSQCDSFRAQFGQSRSFNSLSHKNLIMNMEPLVPALPSTNEYEEAAADSGRLNLRTPVTQHTAALSPPPVTRLRKSHWASLV